MKKNFILSALFILPLIAFAQGKINKKTGLREGKWTIYYKIGSKSEMKYFDPSSKLLDLKNSIIEIAKPTIGQYFVEKCRYNDFGKKDGEFIISIEEISKSGYSLEPIKVIEGKYLEDNLDGEIATYTATEFDSDRNVKNYFGWLKINYSHGAIVDQNVSIPNATKNQLPPQYIKFKNGKLQQMEIGGNFKIARLNSGFEITQKVNDVWADAIITQNTYLKEIVKDLVNTWRGIEHFKTDDKLVSFGQYMLIPFDNKYLNENFNNIDTSKNNLLAICQFKNGLREGKAHFYIEDVFMNKDYNYEKTGKRINYDFNFKNDLLNGPSQIYTKIFEADTNYIRTDNYKDGYLYGDSKTYFEDGKVSMEAYFQNGILSGNLNTYFNSNSFDSWYYSNSGIKKRVVLPSPVVQSMKLEEIDNSKKSEEMKFGILNKIQEKGGKILSSDTTGYYLFSKLVYAPEGKVSVVNSNFYYLYKSGKVMAMFITDTKPFDVSMFDSFGKQVTNLNKYNSEKEAEIKKEIEKINNLEVNCLWCNKPFKFGNRVESDECHCFERSTGKSSSILHFKPRIFCSNDCRAKHEKDCCISNGKGHE